LRSTIGPTAPPDVWPGYDWPGYDCSSMNDCHLNLTYFSSKVEKRESPIDGRGLFAKQHIKTGELVVVKGGYILTKAQRDAIGRELGPSDIHH
jgi:hypothetical protein